MLRGLAAILILATLAGSSAAQDNAHVQALLKRVKLAKVIPEDDLVDSINKFTQFDDQRIKLIGVLVAPFPPHATSGFELLAGAVLERTANVGYDTALTEYRNLLQDDPKLIHRPLRELRGTDGLTSRDSHALALDLLARLPPSILRRYLRLIEGEATGLLIEGEMHRDIAALRRLVREYRPISQANTAAALLGDLEFERGDFDQALDWWRRLAPLPWNELINRRANDFPPNRAGVDLVRIHAKQVLALLFAGRPDAARECEAFRALYPTERGSFAGRNDTYHAILTHWRDELAAAPERDIDRDWPTFAGAPSRNRVLGSAPHNRLWIDGPTWRVPLPKVDVKDPTPLWLSATRSLAVPPTPFHPIVADGQVLISDGHCVHSFDLLTGKPRFRIESPANPVFKKDETPAVEGLAFSVSAAPGRAFARLGIVPGDRRPTKLVCLDLKGDGHTHWSSDANPDEGKTNYFDTDPIVVGERVFIGVLHKDNLAASRHLWCFDLDGVQQWQTQLAEFPDVDDQHIAPPGLLVGAGPVILNATPAGVVVACDSWTGRRLWAFRYPSIAGAMSPRGAASCLAADGRVFLAPADSPSLYCLDAETGRSLWERPWTKNPSDIIVGPPAVSEIVDLLGVVADRLIFTDRSRLLAIEAATGANVEWQQPVVGKLPSQGRGLIAGAWVFWPTADSELSWRIVTHANGTLREADVDPPYYEPTTIRGLPAGNIAFSNGCLVVAGAKELVVYVPAARQLPILERDLQAKTQPAKLFRLAMAQLDNGRAEEAKATLARIERVVAPAEVADWANLIRERMLPSASKAFPDSEPVAKVKELDVEALPVTPLKPAATKLVPAWGPIAGVAPPIEKAHGQADDAVTVVLDGHEIVFLDTRSGDELFRQARRVASVDWIGRSGADVVIAGREGLEAFDVNARRATWRFEAPALLAAHWQLVDERPRRVVGPERLGRFQFVNRFVTFFEDGRQAIALDPATGKIVDVRFADTIGGLAAANPQQLAPWPVSQSARGTKSTTLSMGAWSFNSDEMGLSEMRRRFGRHPGELQMRGEADGVVKFARTTYPLPGSEENTYRPPWPTSLTGGPAHVFGDQSVSLALVPRNYGFDLVRFEREPFRPQWIVPAAELRDGFDVLAATWDERAVYFVHAGELQARDLTNGSLLWKRPLPAANGPWTVERLAGGLIVWPQSAAGLPALSGPVDPFTAAVTLAIGRRGIGAVPIRFVDGKDGAVKQRLDVPHDGGPVFANVQGTRLIVSAGGKVRAWAAVP